MAKSKWTDLKKKGKRGPGYLAILNSKLGKIAKDDKEDMRTLMDDNFAATLLSTHESYVKSERLAKRLNEAIIRGDLGSGETVRVFKKRLRDLQIAYSKEELELDHKDVSQIAFNLQLTHDALLYQKEAYKEVEKTGKDLTVPSGSGVNRKTIDRIIYQIKELQLLEEGLAQQWRGGSTYSMKDISDVINVMDKNKRGQFHINKDKNIKAADGTVMTLQIVDKWRHKSKSEIQQRIGARRTNLLLGGKTDAAIIKESEALAAELAKANIKNITGSESLWNAYKEGFKSVITKGGFKPYKTKSGGTWSGVRAPELKATKNKLRNIAIKAAYAKAGFKNAAAAVSPKKETEHGNIAQQLISIRNKVNRKLPAELRRNMVRPALMNRTGRFANSSVLANLSLSTSGKTVRADYTYLLSPYETFENTGERQWPMGYNPKPLISKSIRNLAEAEIRDKFGIGLTTRRI